MPANVRVSASWKTVAAMHTRVGGSWKNVTEGYTRIGGAWKTFFTSVAPLSIQYLVIAGGGSGGGYVGGGGGAGGLLTSTFTGAIATNYTVTIGAGGAGTFNTVGNNGSNSVFSSFTATGGGRGAIGGGGSTNTGGGGNGGSGGGGGSSTGNLNGGTGTSGQGFAGGNSSGMSGDYGSGGGGGAGAVGETPAATTGGGNGGVGIQSSITGTAVFYAGGGGGANGNAFGSSTPGTGGAGGGGNGALHNMANGATITAATAGTANTGGGGGGGGIIGSQAQGVNGGSGIVIIKYPSNYAINPSAGLSHRTITSGGFNITSFTAGTGTVTFATATTSSYELIQTVYLTESQTSITFDVSGLSSDYQHLQIRATTRTNRSGADSDPIILRFNSDSGSNYTRHGLGGYNFGGTSAMYSNAATSQTSMMLSENMPVAGSTTNAFGAFVTDILDPFETTKNKTVRTLNGMNAAWSSIELRSGAWLNTAAITSITILPLVGTQLAANSRFTIYGIKGS